MLCSQKQGKPDEKAHHLKRDHTIEDDKVALRLRKIP
jgi:hypothetical protein